jgi:HAMP domain-containing protein
MRPVRAALAGDSEIGDDLPRPRPSFAAWSSISMLAVAFVFAIEGAMVAAVFDRVAQAPVMWLVAGCALTLVYAVPITVGTAFAPTLRPIRDLAEGTERVAAGDYSQRLPVVQDDDLGALAASFNRMAVR